MGFSDSQMRALARSVPARHVRSRVRDGKELSYVEGWYVLAQANRIFGFDGWDRETIETKCLLGREARGSFNAVYSARVRITVRVPDGTVIRDGHGTGEAHGGSAGEVHDRALKAAETDATKRALATFGRAFGLALYAGGAASKARWGGQGDPAQAAQASPAQPANGGQLTNGGQQPALVTSTLPSPEGTAANGQSDRVLGEAHPAIAATASAGATTLMSTGPHPDGSSATINVPIRGQRQSIDKSALPLHEPRRVRDKEHLRYVASQPCLLCSATPSDAHHVRFAQPRAMGRKVSDEFTVPLCRAHHRELHHSGNEAAWWHDMGIDPLEITRELWAETRGVDKPGQR